MKPRIPGSGIGGHVLAKAFTNKGQRVKSDTRNTAKEEVAKFKEINPADVGSFAETI